MWILNDNMTKLQLTIPIHHTCFQGSEQGIVKEEEKTEEFEDR